MKTTKTIFKYLLLCILSIVFTTNNIFATPGNKIVLNSSEGQGFTGFDTDKLTLDPTGRWVVFISDEYEPGIYRLSSSAIGGGVSAVHDVFPSSINSNLYNPEFSQIEITPDGRNIIFIARIHKDDVNSRMELFSVPIEGGTIRHITDPSVFNQAYLSISSFQISPDSNKVVFQVLSNTVGNSQLLFTTYSVDIAGGAPIALFTGAGIGNTFNHTPQYQITQDSSQVIFSRLNNNLSATSLFKTPIDSSNIQLLVSSASGRRIADFKVSNIPNKNFIIYRLDSKTAGKYLLHHFNLNTSINSQVNSTSAASTTSTSSDYDFSLDGRAILFITDEEQVGSDRVTFRLLKNNGSLSNTPNASMVQSTTTRFFQTTADGPIILVGFGNTYAFKFVDGPPATLIRTNQPGSSTTNQDVFIAKNRIVNMYKSGPGSNDPFIAESFDFDGQAVKTFSFSGNLFFPFQVRESSASDYFFIRDEEIGAPPNFIDIVRADNQEVFPFDNNISPNSDRFDIKFSQDGQRMIFISDFTDGVTYKAYSQLLNQEQYQDTISPIITINGEKDYYHPRLTEYDELGAVAVDDLDGDISNVIVTTGFVDTGVVGTYVINYSVEDNAGNSENTSRTVRVVEFCGDEPYIAGIIPDTDSDGSNDCFDLCINDPSKTEPGICGCGELDRDLDDDGTIDCNPQQYFTTTLETLDQKITELKPKSKKKLRKALKNNLNSLFSVSSSGLLANSYTTELNELKRYISLMLKSLRASTIDLQKFKKFKRKSKKMISAIVS